MQLKKNLLFKSIWAQNLAKLAIETIFVTCEKSLTRNIKLNNKSEQTQKLNFMNLSKRQEPSFQKPNNCVSLRTFSSSC